jgi:ankyrin repeat protein
MKLFSWILVTLLATIWPIGAQQMGTERPTAASEPRVLILCSPSPGQKPKYGANEWRAPLETAVFRLQALYQGREGGLIVGRSAYNFCPNLEETACIVDELTSHMIYCNSEVLSRSLQAAAYMSVGAAVALMTDLNADPDTILRLPISAFNAYDSVYASRFLAEDRQALAMFRVHQSTGIPLEELNDVGRVVSHIWEDETWGVTRRHFDSPVSGVARNIYEIAVANLLGFIIGHEVSHGYSRCPFSQQSFIELSGLVSDMVAIHLDRDIFPNQPLHLSEVRADVCAARTVEAIDAISVARVAAIQDANAVTSVRPDLLASMGRRIAIDQAGWLLVAGLKAEVKINTHQMQPLRGEERALYYQDRPTDGYLRTPFRLLLLAKTLQNKTSVGRNFVDACDERFDWSMAFLKMDCPDCGPKKPRDEPILRKWLPDCESERYRWLVEPPNLFQTEQKRDARVATKARAMWPANSGTVLPKDTQPAVVSTELGELIQAILSNDTKSVQSRLALKPELALSAPIEGIPTLLHLAARLKDPEIAALLLDAGAPPVPDWRGRAAIMTAAVHGNDATVRLLAKRAGGFDTRDGAGDTALFAAINQRSLDTVDALVTAGADVNLPNRVGELPLTAAVLSGQAATVRLLLSKGAQANKTLPDGNAAIHFAAVRGDDEIVGLLLQAGADADLRTRIGKGALHFATMGGQVKVVNLLLRQPADPDAVDLEQCTPLFFAAALGHSAILEALLAHGASKESTNNNKTTPLLAAIRYGHENLAELLITNRTAVLPDADGRTPLMEAQAKGNANLVALLRQYGAK